MLLAAVSIYNLLATVGVGGLIVGSMVALFAAGGLLEVAHLRRQGASAEAERLLGWVMATQIGFFVFAH